ncbi:Helix-turn-helix domain-containing protein [Butyrivibrio proteoclasticus]|uniref:Helix-turn-helix domain-containing protein n=1 Tax=Butyrivibrio proteoclasticus TaxID=43305 RepID=A0A1I5YAP6_9FIRM|nr:helix-turn-helix transcriptional regulator [Butyrivibrio proteoclasticus]SFQ41256.1 Helix-turn-helix domain-containing protein [Butyrivibrio proteoclasticus]
MKSHITLQERLKDLRTEKGLTLKELEAKTGISSSALGEYETDENKGIPHYVLVALADFYNVSLDYLFDKSEVRENTNRDITELNLSDSVLDVLKSGTINNRLLGEIICHPSFKKLMADTEIFVDGVASQSVQSVNAYADVLRKRIMGEFNPSADDAGLLVLDACTIEEERYFLNKLQLDLEPIVKDIRTAHVSDKETATDTTVADRVNELFDNVKKHKDDFMSILTFQFCRELGMNPKNLSPLELETLQGIFARSKNYKQVMNSRKNKKKHK